MRNILLLFAKYGAHLLFVGLEILCFYLVINYNKSQNDIFLNSSNLFSGKVDEKVDDARDYFYLEDINDSLQVENGRLIETMINRRNKNTTSGIKDTIINQYKVIPATICGRTIHVRHNSFVLCEGADAGIREGMGVITAEGILGVIRNVSKNYSNVLPLINNLSRTSCLIKGKNFPGILQWKDRNPLKMQLNDVPKHARIGIGDTIITSGYSTIFPKGIALGVISNFTADKGSATYQIDVDLWTDLTRVEYVYVIDNRHKNELDSLRNLIADE